MKRGSRCWRSLYLGLMMVCAFANLWRFLRLKILVKLELCFHFSSFTLLVDQGWLQILIVPYMYHTRTPIYIIWGGETSNMCFCSPLKLGKMSKIWLTYFSDVCRNHQPQSYFFPCWGPPVSFLSLPHWPPQISVATNDLMQGMQVGEPLVTRRRVVTTSKDG